MTFSFVYSVVSSSSSLASFSTFSFNLSLPYSILSVILLYNKKSASRVLYSLFESESCVAAADADTALHNLLILFLKNVFIFIIYFLKLVRGFSLSFYFVLISEVLKGVFEIPIFYVILTKCAGT